MFLRVVAFAAVLAGLHAAHSAPATLATLEGNYSKNGRVILSRGSDRLWTGDARIRMQADPKGATGSLRIRGRITGRGAQRAYDLLVTFDEFGVSSLSNLAPGFEDGYAAEGSYSQRHRRITASYVFRVGTTPGTAEVFIRLQKRKKLFRLLVRQTLKTEGMLSPLTWTFAGITKPKSAPSPTPSPTP